MCSAPQHTGKSRCTPCLESMFYLFHASLCIRLLMLDVFWLYQLEYFSKRLLHLKRFQFIWLLICSIFFIGEWEGWNPTCPQPAHLPGCQVFSSCQQRHLWGTDLNTGANAPLFLLFLCVSCRYFEQNDLADQSEWGRGWTVMFWDETQWKKILRNFTLIELGETDTKTDIWKFCNGSIVNLELFF